MKKKYNTNLVNCIETELYPIMSEKIVSKMMYDVDRKVTTLSAKFVGLRDFELGIGELKQSAQQKE